MTDMLGARGLGWATLAAAGLALAGAAPAWAGRTERVSISPGGQQGNGQSLQSSISADGRFVAFHSDATNLVPGDTNGWFDAFVHDRKSGRTERVSVSSSGRQGDGPSFFPSLSAGGHFVAFYSGAANLVPGDTNLRTDVFVRDRRTGKTERVSVSSTGEQGDDDSDSLSISADGRFVAFMSAASNLVPGDTNRECDVEDICTTDVFVRDRVRGTTVRVSVSSRGEQANNASYFPSISADGRFVAFISDASNLVPGDTGHTDVFVRDRVKGTTGRVSVSSRGEQGNSVSVDASISAHGRFIAFDSDASNLVPDDSNSARDVFVRDRKLGTTERVSLGPNGAQSNGDSDLPSISADGRYVAFRSAAANLVPGDTNGMEDVFVRDRVAGVTTRVSISSRGKQGDNSSDSPAISADGQFVAFQSPATNFVPGDTNGVDDIFVRTH